MTFEKASSFNILNNFKSCNTLTKMGKRIKLVTSNGNSFDVSDKVVSVLPAIIRMVKESENEECDILELVLIHVNSAILQKVIQWATHHSNEQKVSSTKNDGEIEEFDSWEVAFIKQQDTGILMELILAAQYLEVKRLGDLASERVAKIIKRNSAEQNRQIFGAEAMDILESGLNKMV